MSKVFHRAIVAALLSSGFPAFTEEPETLRPDFTLGLWATTESLYSPGDVERLIAVAYAFNFNAIYLQVRRAGDAYYSSATEPRSRKLEGQPDDYDPLGYALELADLFNLEIHAWLNVNYCWPGPAAAPADEHIANRRPEWVLVGRDGRRMTAYSRARMSALDAEGWYLNPAAPGFAEYFAGVAVEVATNYPVAGIHLDFIRYPNFRFGYSAEDRRDFLYERGGPDPVLFGYQYPGDELFLRAYGTYGLADRWLGLRSLEWWDWRADAVTRVVREVKNAVETARPDCPVSAAVWQHPEHAYRYVGQDWLAWVERDYVDVIIPMAYHGPPAAIRALDERVARHCLNPRGRMMGVGAFNHDAEYTAEVCETLYESGTPGVVLFDYLSLLRNPGILAEFRATNAGERTPAAGHRDGLWYRKWYALRQ